jgi:hypothetical protein
VHFQALGINRTKFKQKSSQIGDMALWLAKGEFQKVAGE